MTMAGTGRRVKFHGSFKRKEDARRKERATRGAYIEARNVKGQGRRYIVITRRAK